MNLRRYSMNNSKHLKKVLLTMIDSLSTEHRDFFLNPDTNFTRQRKLPLNEVVKLILCMEAGSLKDELYKYFGLNIENPTASAFVQQRGKIKADAFQWLFHSFNDATRNKKNNLYKGYRLLAIDGSSIPIRTDVSDKDTYVVRNGNHIGYNAYHLNASYDLLEHTYDDVILQGEAHLNENYAFNKLIDRYDKEKAIFIADRGYESYNSFVHVINSGQKFLVRIKDIHSPTSMARGMHLNADGEFDIDVCRTLTTKQTKETKEHPELYKIMVKNNVFEFFSKENPFYNFKCRIIRFKITEDTYETIITSLDRNEFDVNDIKNLYNLRWGIETSFRELKYAVCLNAFHAKKNESIKQEIYARLLFYNFSERIMRAVSPKISKRDRKYKYQINFTRAFHNIRIFLRNKKGGKQPPLESIIAKEMEPIRPNRSNPRKVRIKHAVYFVYRFD